MDESQQASAIRRGIGVALIGMMMFSCVDVLNKLLAAHLPVWQILFVRFLGFVPIAALLAYRPGAGVVWRTPRPWFQALRGLVLAIEMALFVAAVKYIHLADLHAIAASAPLMVVALSVPLLGEAVGWRRWSAVAIGFVGVLIIVRPGFQELNEGALLTLGGTVLWALYQIMLRVVGRHDSAGTTALWSAVMGTLASAVVVPFVWEPPTATGWLLLAAVALVGGVAHTVYSRAFVLAPAAAVQPFNYLLIVFSGTWGFLVFDHLPDRWTVAGAAVIVTAGLYAFYREHVRGRRTMPELA